MAYKGEDSFQVSIAKFLDLLAGPWGFQWFHVPNETGIQLPIQVMVKRKKMGVKPGVGDCVIVKEGGSMFYVELKLPKRKQSKSQKEWQRRCQDLNIPYYLCDTTEKVVAALNKEFNQHLKVC